MWPYLLAVFLLPLLVLWRQDDALYSPPGVADAWFYLGYFRNLLEYKRDLFYDLYYGSRMAWLLPGFLAHSLFSPQAANFVLHLTVQSTATLSFFSILRLIAGLRSAFLATLVFAVQPWLWAATGSDYVDGPSIAYGLLAMAFFTHAAARPRGKWMLCAAGAALACMVYTQLFCLSFVPLMLLCYLALHWAWRRTPFIRSALDLCLWASAGFGIVTAAFAGINYLLDGNVWFYSPSLAQAGRMSKEFPATLRRPIWQDHALVPWLWPAVVASLAAIAFISSRISWESLKRDAGALLLSLQLLLAAALMGWMQYRGASVLGHPDYASLLLPFEFLVLGVLFWTAAETIGNSVYVVLCTGAILLFAALWYGLAGYQALAAPLTGKVGPALIAACLAPAFLLRRRLIGSILAIAGFTVLTAVALLQASAMEMHSNRSQFDRLMHLEDRIQEIRKGRAVRFWFDRESANATEYFDLNSLYLADYTLLSDHFPAGCEAPVDPDTLVVVAAQDQHAADLARNALLKCWEPAGMHPAMEATEMLQSPHGPYTVAIFRSEADPKRLRPLRAVFDSAGRGELLPLDSETPSPLPLDRWVIDQFPFDRPLLRPVTGGVEVRTPVRPFYFATQYPPLAVPFTGWFNFVLRLKSRTGCFAFGARPGDDSTYLAADRFGHRVGDRREMSIWVNLKQGDTVRLRTANNDLLGFGAATFVMEQLTVTGAAAQ